MLSDESSKSKEEYGELYKEHQFEQYKIFICSAEKISDMRININKFFITINSIIVTVLGLFLDNLSWAICLIPILGITISILWIKNITSYSKLNSVKFEIINEIENILPLSMFKKEWDKLKDDKKYNTLSNIEKKTPYVFIILYIVLFFKLIH
ncbi:hypothetical protein RYE13_18960 [Clostridioides difficile]|nr:hypothetical protein [Clostridioides difficile]